MKPTVHAPGRLQKRRPKPLLVALGIAGLVGAFLLRVWNLPAAPAMFHPTRQYAGLSLAKAWSQVGSDDPARLAAIEANGDAVPRLEPRILEAVVAGGYRLFGVVTWFGGLLSSLLWCAGAVLLFVLARRLASNLAGWIAAGFYLFVPYGIEASRSFQPDPAMVVFTIGAVLAVVAHSGAPTTRRLVLAALLAGVAILLKPVSLFPIAGAFVAVALSTGGLHRGLVRPSTLAYAALGILPSASYYLYGVVAGGDLSSFASSGFIPRLWFDGDYWQGWLDLTHYTVTLPMLLAAAVSIFVAQRRLARHAMLGLLGGHAAMCLAFTYHAHTHDYYHLPLLPVVGLGLGLTADAVAARLRRRDRSVLLEIAGPLSLVVVAASIAVADLRVARRDLTPTAQRHVSDAAVIGELVDHSLRTVVVAPAYGAALFYEGEFSGVPWPTRGDLRFSRLRGENSVGIEERFAELTATADWFVVTDFDELAGQPELRSLLEEHGTLVAEEPGYLVYDLTP